MLPILVLVLGLAQLAPTVAQDPARTCEIRGRVTDKDTGQPITRALVQMHSQDGQERFSTHTDATGNFRFTRLAPGQYSGIVQSGPFRSTHAFGGLSGGTGRPILLKEGEVREIDVALARTYAIDVRVVDEWGHPLSAVMVSATSVTLGGATAPIGNHTTDDRGRQRVFGLTPGRYIVCAQSDVIGISMNGRRDALLRTCYPSALDDAEAQPVRVDSADVGEIVIRMRSGRTFAVSGRVVDAAGAPAPAAHLMLAKHWTNGSAGTSVFHTIQPDGQFRIPHVHPGEYAIEASVGGTESPEHRRPLERAFASIRVDDADVANVLIALQKAVDVGGRIRLEDPSAAFNRTPGYGAMSVWSRLAEDAGPGRGSLTSDVIGDDLRFTMRRVFGRRTLELMNVPRGWYVKSIRYSGNEIVDQPTTFKDTAEPAIEILLSNRGAVVTGRVTDDGGDAVQGATVVMFAADRERMAWRSPHSARASRAGEFRAGPVRGGDYFLVALPADTRPIQAGDSRRLERLATVAERVTLGDLDERAVDLRLVIKR